MYYTNSHFAFSHFFIINTLSVEMRQFYKVSPFFGHQSPPSMAKSSEPGVEDASKRGKNFDWSDLLEVKGTFGLGGHLLHSSRDSCWSRATGHNLPLTIPNALENRLPVLHLGRCPNRPFIPTFIPCLIDSATARTDLAEYVPFPLRSFLPSPSGVMRMAPCSNSQSYPHGKPIHWVSSFLRATEDGN